ncbi:endonuclease/exonuclease/phosphatase family protein [Streptomyces yaizuensis]|uniref:endonuclease/exonuclease/phosphatase family protein n=1 Tax=Streptomyces yaizuensis TaxID=2989713 RepID=UPI002B21A2ED|nr:endonuclease/exonuclease/phosphatase family protein [Streptomyces sp. YSPA8]
MSSVGRILLAVLLPVGLLFATGPVRADVPDPVSWPRPRFLSYNVCGASCSIYQGSKPAWRDKVVGAVDAWDTDLLMLQELCHGQWTLLRDALGNRSSGGPSYDSAWGAALGSASGCAKWGPDTRYGLAVFARGGPGTIDNGSRTVTFLDRPSAGEQRILLCARTRVTGRDVRACNTHLDYRGDNPRAQAGQVAALTRGFANQGEPVVLAGDFNMLPKDRRMDPLYHHSGGTGIFQEADENDKSYFRGADCPQSGDRCRSGEATAEPVCSPRVTEPGKIDYIFLGYAWFQTVRGDAAACTPGMSDHHLLRGAAAWER